MVIKHAFVSIGELSAEAAESNNREIKKCRLQHTRKMSLILTNTDLMKTIFKIFYLGWGGPGSIAGAFFREPTEPIFGT